jgi:hypothetical protein
MSPTCQSQTFQDPEISFSAVVPFFETGTLNTRTLAASNLLRIFSISPGPFAQRHYATAIRTIRTVLTFPALSAASLSPASLRFISTCLRLLSVVLEKSSPHSNETISAAIAAFSPWIHYSPTASSAQDNLIGGLGRQGGGARSLSQRPSMNFATQTMGAGRARSLSRSQTSDYGSSDSEGDDDDRGRSR